MTLATSEAEVVTEAQRRGMCIYRLTHACIDALARAKGQGEAARLCARRARQAAERDCRGGRR